VLSAAALTIAACSRSPRPSVDRIAILPFENLSGNPSLDWISTAAPSILSGQLVGSSATVPLRAASVSDAYLDGATRLLHGNFTSRGGTLDFEIETEDATRHKMIARDDLKGAVLEVMNRAAHQIDSQARPFSTANPEALAAWARGDNERAVELDPDFGAAWFNWAEALSSHGKSTEAIAVVARALDRPALRSPIDRARLNVLAATLGNDPVAREKALADLQRLNPADTALLDQLAQAATRARDFSTAAAAYRKVLDQQPANPAALLAMGYAQAFAGDPDAARRTFEDYGRQEGQKTNSLDSLGEAYFMNGHFPDARKYFLEAYRSNPKFLDGVDLEKAAYAQWLAGDLKKADALMAEYLDARRKPGDALAPWREANWDYATGRRDLALQTIAKAPEKLAQNQIAVWNSDAPADLNRLKAAYEASAPSTDGFIRTFYAAALLKAGNRDEARRLIARWPLPVENLTQAQYESVVFPKFLELRKQLQ
jgi:tetratricopeptide (TPR) repeat protein